MLRDDIARYTELSGNDGEHTPIGIIGAFLDGYETGLKDRPNGEWNDDDFCGDYVCSVCKQEFDSDIPNMRGFDFALPKFCPNCGADMRGDKK